MSKGQLDRQEAHRPCWKSLDNRETTWLLQINKTYPLTQQDKHTLTHIQRLPSKQPEFLRKSHPFSLTHSQSHYYLICYWKSLMCVCVCVVVDAVHLQCVCLENVRCNIKYSCSQDTLAFMTTTDGHTGEQMCVFVCVFV